MHVGILVGRDVKQPEVAPTEIIGRLRILVFRGVRLEPLVRVEGMLVALEFFRIRQLAAGGEHAILCLARGGLGTDRLDRQRVRGCANSLRRLGDLQARDEAFEISLLFGLEVAGRGFARRLECCPGLSRHPCKQSFCRYLSNDRARP
jgi:hypothetical protein